jgi:hypothetical protein
LIRAIRCLRLDIEIFRILFESHQDYKVLYHVMTKIRQPTV